MDCPECRKKVTIPIDLLPPNILANRILESMTQTQPPPHPPPSLPNPKRNNSFNLISKPPAPTPSESVPTSLPLSSFPISSANTTPIKLPVFSSQMASVDATVSVGSSKSHIPGNPSTNPFINLIDATPYYSQVQKANANLTESLKSLELGCKAGSEHNVNVLTGTNTDQTLIESLPRPAVPPPRPPVTSSPGLAGPPLPPLPDRNKLKVSQETKQWQLSPRALIDPPASSRPSPAVSLYRAVFEYKASQGDELSLKKGELYEVTEKCHDGWFKGKHINTGNVGVFPGNHVKEFDPKQTKKPKRKELVSVKEKNLIDLSDEEQKAVSDCRPETDAERLQKLKKIRETLRQAQQQQQHQHQQGQKSAVASGQTKTKAEKYRSAV